MQFQSYKIADLIPASYNPRKKLKPGDKEYEKIKNSIKEFGYVEPIIINSDMTIIGGHQRATVLADLGYTEVECIVVDIDKTKEKALNVALNKITGEWNKELLADLIKDLEDSDFDVGITGFEPPEIEQLFNSVHDKKITEDDFDVEAELAKPTVAKTGDVWLLGKHRVICGDSILPETTGVVIEVATFTAGTIRQTGKRFDEKTDASIRYEKGLDTQRVDQGICLLYTSDAADE